MYNFIDNNGSQIHKINMFNLYIVFEIKYANKCDIFFFKIGYIKSRIASYFMCWMGKLLSKWYSAIYSPINV